MLTTQDAARELGIHRSRVLHLIAAGRLPATRWGRQWAIRPEDLEGVRERKAGRPSKVPNDARI